MRAPVSVVFLWLATATSAAAQKPPRLGTIAGVVKDSLGQPIADVEVSALAAAKNARSDSAGRFMISDLTPGNLNVAFRRLSYAPIVLIITVPSADTTDVEVVLGIAAHELTGVVVQERPDQLRRLVAFESRRKSGIGHFITRSEIEDRHPLLLSDMMRTVPGAMLISAENGRTALRFSRSGRTNCPPQFFVDGIQVTGYNIDDMPPGDVEGVELYSGAAGLPPEFNRFYSTTNCGTVVIWTRIPSLVRKPSEH